MSHVTNDYDVRRSTTLHGHPGATACTLINDSYCPAFMRRLKGKANLTVCATPVSNKISNFILVKIWGLLSIILFCDLFHFPIPTNGNVTCMCIGGNVFGCVCDFALWRNLWHAPIECAIRARWSTNQLSLGLWHSAFNKCGWMGHPMVT